MEEIKKLDEHWRFTKCDVKVNELIDVINELIKEVEELKLKQEKLRKPCYLDVDEYYPEEKEAKP